MYVPGKNALGFTLIELAVVMVVIGLLAGGGVSLMGMLSQRKARGDALEYLKTARTAIVAHAERLGALPYADTNGDGSPDGTATLGTVPYVTLGLQPKDAWQRGLKYELNPGLAVDRSTSCAALKGGLGGNPQVADNDAGAGAGVFPVAAVIVSAGPTNADGAGDVFDQIIAGSVQGDNTDGRPNWLRHPPVNAFDDLALYLGGNELYGHICDYLIVAVNNASAATVYVYNRTQGADLGSVPAGGTGAYDILSGTRVEARTASGGGGVLVTPTTPPTPLTLAGQDFTVNIP
ncbi:MAG: type II secretion system GspH family protein [Desulfobacterales bacterium]|nr:type II secretion system GspH family protein [Desulfobacterales bacterium]